MDIQKFSILLLTLPDGKLVLQRRTKDAPQAPGKLGLFGGWVEEGETPEECIKREIEEETSLNSSNLTIEFVANFILPADSTFTKDRHFYLYKSPVESVGFAVYEGDGAEVYSLDEIQKRSDLVTSSQYAFQKVILRILP